VPINENQLIRETAQAAQSETLLRSIVFQAAVAAVKDEYLRTLLNSRVEDTDGREFAFQRLRAIDDIVGKLEQAVETGKLAKRQLEAQQRLDS
jgi:hypothetical protein